MKSIRQQWGSVAVEIVVNIVLPYVAYRLVAPHAGDVKGLFASMIPPLVWSLIEFARKRRIDILSIFILAGIALSLLAFLGGGSVRFLQLRENLVTGLFALAFLISAAIRRPLIYELARASMRRKSAAEAESFEQLNRNRNVRHSMMVMTVVWGAGLLAQTALACVLIFTMSIATYIVVSPIVGYAGIGLLALWTMWYVRRQRRLGAARAARDARDATAS